MPALHVYHDGAGAQLADLVRAAGSPHEVIALTSPAALRDQLAAIEILFAPDPPRTGWTGAAKLRLVQILGAGVERLLPSPDLPAHVAIAGARGVFAAEVAEHAVAMLLMHARRIIEQLDDQRARRFVPTPRATLHGSRLTIVGLGEIGRRIAAIARAIGMHVRGVSRTAQPLDGVEVIADLATGVADAHYVVLALPLTPATHHLCGASLLACMRPDAFLVNVSRGGLVDQVALAEALHAGRLGGAALDVFEVEPLPFEDPLWTTPRVIISPHIAGLGDHYVERCVEVLLDNVARLASGAPLRCRIDRSHGY